ncbi:FkbM family methyltransferase [Streptomyces cavourensis]
MPASVLARALRTYVRHAPGTLGKAQIVDRFLDEHLRTHPVHTTVRLRSGDTVPVTTSDVIQRFQYLFGEWEPNQSAFLRDRLHPGDTFIDVGAHRGAFSLLASHAVGPHGRVVAIELHPRFHDDLTAAAAANRRTNIHTVRSAASDTTGALTLYLEDPSNLGHTTAIRPRHVHATAEVPIAPVRPDQPGRPRHHARHQDRRRRRRSRRDPRTPARTPVPARRRRARRRDHPRLLAKQGESAAAIIATLRTHGFHPYTLTNDYDPATYPRAMCRPQPPIRCTTTPKDMTDLVFARTDATSLPLAP